MRLRFPGTLQRRAHEENEEDAWFFKCDHSTPINVNDTNKLRKSPCTFHLIIRRIDDVFEFSGCHSHFGHEVVSNEDVNEVHQHPQYFYGEDHNIGQVTYMHEGNSQSNDFNVVELMNSMVNVRSYEEDQSDELQENRHVVLKNVHHYSQPCSVPSTSIVPEDTFVLSVPPSFVVKNDLHPFPDHVLEEPEEESREWQCYSGRLCIIIALHCM